MCFKVGVTLLSPPMLSLQPLAAAASSTTLAAKVNWHQKLQEKLTAEGAGEKPMDQSEESALELLLGPLLGEGTDIPLCSH